MNIKKGKRTMYQYHRSTYCSTDSPISNVLICSIKSKKIRGYLECNFQDTPAVKPRRLAIFNKYGIIWINFCKHKKKINKKNRFSLTKRRSKEARIYQQNPRSEE